MFMAQESCPTESLKGIVCSEIMTLRVFSRRCLTARIVPGTEGGAHPCFRCSLSWIQLKRKDRLEWMCHCKHFVFPFILVSFPGYWQVLIKVKEEAAVSHTFSEAIQPKDNKWGIGVCWKSWKNQDTNLNTSAYHLMWLISSEVSVFFLHFDCRYRL